MEREHAEKLYGKRKVQLLAFGKRAPKWVHPPAQPIACLSTTTKEMFVEIEKVKHKRARQAQELERTALLAEAAALVGTTHAAGDAGLGETSYRCAGERWPAVTPQQLRETGLHQDAALHQPCGRAGAESQDAGAAGGTPQAAATDGGQKTKSSMDVTAGSTAEATSSSLPPIPGAGATITVDWVGAPEREALTLVQDKFKLYETRKNASNETTLARRVRLI